MYAKINGYNIFFDVEGLQYVPDGPTMREKPVCFVLHGGPGADHSAYIPDLSPLSEYCQLVYIDDRNSGRSERIDPTTNSMEQDVEDAEALREYLGLDKIFILGQSYGGMEAQHYIIHHPEHLYGAMILCTSPNAAGVANDRVARHILEFGTQEQYDIWTGNLVVKGEITLHEYFEKMLPLYHGKGKFKGQETINEYVRVITNDAVIAHQMGNDLATYDFLPELKNVDLPCLVMAGEKDFICDLEANTEIANAIPGCEFHVIEGASHEIIADYPEQVLPVLRDFIAKHFKK